jgi:hypothetical protein
MSYKPSKSDEILFKRVEQMRRPNYAPATRIVQRYLRTVKKRAAKAFRDTGGDQIAASRSASDPVLVRKMITDIWILTAPKFGNWTQDRLQRQLGMKSIQTKALSEDMWVQIITAHLLDYGAELVQGIDATTVKAIAKVMVTGIQQGLSIPGIAASLVQDHPFLDFARATLIARTEVIGASNWGSLEGAKRSGSATLKKYWIPTLDNKTRKSHELAGITFSIESAIPLNDSFIVEGEQMLYPGDPSAPPSLVCNCRCTIGYKSGLLDALQ